MLFPTRETRTFPEIALNNALGYADLPLDSVIESYSGRGMYGGECFAIKLGELGNLHQQIGTLIYAIGNVCHEDYETPSCASRECGGCDQCEGPSIEEAGRLMCSSLQVDNLGHGYVAYFPGWKVGEYLS